MAPTHRSPIGEDIVRRGGEVTRAGICLTPRSNSNSSLKKRCTSALAVFVIFICFVTFSFYSLALATAPWVSNQAKVKKDHILAMQGPEEVSNVEVWLNSAPPTPPGSASRFAPSVAICLVGGARAFEVTGPSLVANLIQAYPRAVLFVHSPLNADTHKLSILRAVRAVGGITILKQQPLPESDVARKVLLARDSPNGIQGLLQYFQLVQGCNDLIGHYEAQHRMEFDWVLRSRLDAFWAASPPPLETLDRSKFYVPYGSDWSGVNDRFGLGNSSSSRLINGRLDAIPLLHRLGKIKLNSEKFLQAQFAAANLAPIRIPNLPMCIVSRRTYSFPMDSNRAVPVVRLGGPGAVNGVKCRPCPKPSAHKGGKNVGRVTGWSWQHPMMLGKLAGLDLVGGDVEETPVRGKWHLLMGMTGEAAQKAVGQLAPYYGRFVEDPSRTELELCNASADWPADWPVLFDEAVDARLAAGRSRLASRTKEECLHQVDALRRVAAKWTGPSPQEICSVGYPPANGEPAQGFEKPTV